MATAKKLPSGQWRTLVYDYTDSEKKRHYESFTATTKKEADYLAAEFALNKKKLRNNPERAILRDVITKYINSSDAVLSPRTIEEYKKIQKNGFANIMDLPISKLSNEVLQESVNNESKRMNKRRTKNPKTISPKTVANSYGLIVSAIKRYYKSVDTDVRLPAKIKKIIELPNPEIICDAVKGTDIELAVLLGMWLSFSMSEIRGIEKSVSLKSGYIVINQVIVDVENKPVKKNQAKALTRIRQHKIPPYIQKLIDELDPKQDYLVTKSGPAISKQFKRIMIKNGMPDMTFHKLRHINASVMALLRVPDKYAMERGGWKTDRVMKDTYTHTFSAEREEVDDLVDSYFNGRLQN